MTSYAILGLMSGTSLDGLDIAFCRFHFDGRWHFEILETETFGYDVEWQQRLQELPNASALDLAQTHVEYGRLLGSLTRGFIDFHSLKPDLIASHGHTIFHDPGKGLSLQIGDGATIHALTGLPVVTDFRNVDIQLGGQGAPLVPIGDKLLFPQYDYLLNLGGIANISFEQKGERLAFDVCPCNLVLNWLARKAGQDYDDEGLMSSSGNANSDLMVTLNNNPYLRLQPPKSLDKTEVEKQFIPVLNDTDLPIDDKLATVTEFIAMQVSQVIMNGDKGKKLLLTGGGTFNTFLVERIKEHCSAEVVVPEKKLVAYKEALIFAFLGLLRMLQEDNVYSSYTGAVRSSIGGALWGKWKG